MSDFHKSVLLKETIEYLNVGTGKKYIDATLGGGGHSGAILDKGGIVLGVDVDNEALGFVEKNFKFQISNFKLKLAKGNFRDIDKIAKENGFEKVAGAVFDLGVSSHQIDEVSRGFSFQKDGPLDMRMDRDLSVKAEGLVNILTKGELYELLNKFGEERFGHAIAERIVRARKISPITTTGRLVEVVRSAVPRFNPKINPATRVFQALRIAVNDELGSISEALPKAFGLLEKNGRLCVISFHSLEDRIVKNYFKSVEDQGLGKIITKKPVTPSEEEIEENVRARSSKLRVVEKV